MRIRVFMLSAAAGVIALATPTAASAASCGDDGTTKFFNASGTFFDLTETPATLSRDNAFATLYDAGSNGPADSPPGAGAASDSYDSWGALFVGGAADSDLYYSSNNDSCTLEDGGQEVAFPKLTIHGLQVQRKIYMPLSGIDGARMLNLVTNPGASPVTTSIQIGDTKTADNEGDLGSDDETTVTADSSGDDFFDGNDLWAVTNDEPLAPAATTSDPTLGHVLGGVGGSDPADQAGIIGDNLLFRYKDVTIPPGETVAYMNWETQTVLTGRDAIAETMAAAGDAQALAANTSSAYGGMSAAEIAALRNWNDKELRYSFSAPKKQKSKSLKVVPTCIEEGCQVTVTGKLSVKGGANFRLKKAVVQRDAGDSSPVSLSLKGKKAKKKLKQAFKKKKKVTATFTSTAVDAAGTQASGKASSKLKK